MCIRDSYNNEMLNESNSDIDKNGVSQNDSFNNSEITLNNSGDDEILTRVEVNSSKLW